MKVYRVSGTGYGVYLLSGLFALTPGDILYMEDVDRKSELRQLTTIRSNKLGSSITNNFRDVLTPKLYKLCFKSVSIIPSQECSLPLVVMDGLGVYSPRFRLVHNQSSSHWSVGDLMDMKVLDDVTLSVERDNKLNELGI